MLPRLAALYCRAPGDETAVAQVPSRQGCNGGGAAEISDTSAPAATASSRRAMVSWQRTQDDRKASIRGYDAAPWVMTITSFMDLDRISGRAPRLGPLSAGQLLSWLPPNISRTRLAVPESLAHHILNRTGGKMSAPPKLADANEIAFFLQTNEPVPARALLDFIGEIEKLARSRRHLGPDAMVEIVEVITGTKLVRMTFDRKLAMTGLAVAVLALANDVAGRIQEPTGRLPQTVARMCVDNGVVECVITTSEGQIMIGRDAIPAVAQLRDRREAAAIADAEAGAAQAVPRERAAKPETLEGPSEPGRLRALDDIVAAGLGRVSDGRVYTLVGSLQQPDGGAREWRFTSQAGKLYIARGVNPERSATLKTDPVVIRADVVGQNGGLTVLNVLDVFEPEEP